MSTCHASISTTQSWEKRGGLGECCQNSFEARAFGKRCPRYSEVPDKSLICDHHGELSSAFTEKRKSQRCERKKTETLSAATANSDGAPNHNHSANTKKDIQNLEAAKAAIIFMGLPELIVQLVIDLEPLEPGLAFQNAEQLYERAQEVLGDPQRQTHLFQKLYEHQQRHDSNKAEAARENIPTGMSESSCQSAKATSSSTSFTTAPVGAAGSLQSETVSTPVETIASSEGVACKPQEASECLSSKLGKASEVTAACAASAEDARIANSHVCLLPKHVSNERTLLTSDERLEKDPSGSEEPEPARTLIRKEKLQEKVQKLAEENRRLTQRKLCRACKQVELASSGVTFLPCGHFITCEVCSEKFDNCPSCGKVIMGTVRTFLS